MRRFHWHLFALILLAGCARQEPKSQALVEEPAPSKTVGQTEESKASQDSNSDEERRLHQTFAEATISTPPGEWHRPPDVTMTGKSVGKLFMDVEKSWNAIRFTNAKGKRIDYRALIETDCGKIEIMLWPEIAPNHVRSFIALAQAGYFDGLVFERAITETIDGHDTRLELLEGGCPAGTGELGQGSIGYWLNPELNDEITHDEGVIGASHGNEIESAACKFYILLARAPLMDGSYTAFGKVTNGLDVARKIFALPKRNDLEYPDGDRPVNPVVMKKVTVEAMERQ